MLSGRGLCDELITRPEESYRLCCVVVCHLETSRMDAPYICIYDISRLRVKVHLVGVFIQVIKKETFTPKYVCYHSCILRHSNAVMVSKYLHWWQLYMPTKNGCEFPWHYPTTDTQYFSLFNFRPSKTKKKGSGERMVIQRK